MSTSSSAKPLSGEFMASYLTRLIERADGREGTPTLLPPRPRPAFVGAGVDEDPLAPTLLPVAPVAPSPSRPAVGESGTRRHRSSADEPVSEPPVISRRPPGAPVISAASSAAVLSRDAMGDRPRQRHTRDDPDSRPHAATPTMRPRVGAAPPALHPANDAALDRLPARGADQSPPAGPRPPTASSPPANPPSLEVAGRATPRLPAPLPGPVLGPPPIARQRRAVRSGDDLPVVPRAESAPDRTSTAGGRGGRRPEPEGLTASALIAPHRSSEPPRLSIGRLVVEVVPPAASPPRATPRVSPRSPRPFRAASPSATIFDRPFGLAQS